MEYVQNLQNFKKWVKKIANKKVGCKFQIIVKVEWKNENKIVEWENLQNYKSWVKNWAFKSNGSLHE